MENLINLKNNLTSVYSELSDLVVLLENVSKVDDEVFQKKEIKTLSSKCEAVMSKLEYDIIPNYKKI